MAEEKVEKRVQHLKRDPNDPRNRKPATTGFTLTDEKPAPVQEVTKSEVDTGHGTLHLGADPNDVRLVTQV